MKPTPIRIADLEYDPHLLYKHHRPLTPFIQRDDGIFVAIRAADVERLATDPRTRQMEIELAWSRGVTEGPLFDFFKNTMLLSNGPEHRKRRAPLSRAFALKVINDLRPHVRAVANSLIDQHYARGEMHFRDGFAAWLPARVTADMLGISTDDIPQFTRNVYKLSRALGSSFTRADVPDLEAAAQQLTLYVERLLHDRRAQPREDLLTTYVQTVDEAEALTRLETLIQIVTLILAGSDTTRGAMTIQISLLLQNRPQWDALCRDPSLRRGAVLECLRYEPAVASFSRVTLEDIEIDACTVPGNSILSLSMLSAMRDPMSYHNPDRFDITRGDHPRRPVIFGAGAHRCLGEMLALLELEEGLAALAERLPQLRLIGGPPTVAGSGGIRRIGEMQVGW